MAWRVAWRRARALALWCLPWHWLRHWHPPLHYWNPLLLVHCLLPRLAAPLAPPLLLGIPPVINHGCDGCKTAADVRVRPPLPLPPPSPLSLRVACTTCILASAPAHANRRARAYALARTLQLQHGGLQKRPHAQRRLVGITIMALFNRNMTSHV